MGSKLDYPCNNYEEYEEIKKQLGADGYSFEKNYIDDPSIYENIILQLENQGDMNSIRKEKRFKNQIGEMEWYWAEGGYIVKKVQGFSKDKKPVQGLVAFFVKNALDDILIENEADEQKPSALPKTPSQEDILADDFFKGGNRFGK